MRRFIGRELKFSFVVGCRNVRARLIDRDKKMMLDVVNSLLAGAVRKIWRGLAVPLRYTRHLTSMVSSRRETARASIANAKKALN